jgi:hypothetical protein
MDDKKKIKLIKLDTIGCISADDQAALNSLMTEDENFPWNELGQFQNLVALIPSSLQIEKPSWELKDKVARKLYDLRDEIKKQQEQKAPVVEAAETEEKINEDKEEGITIEDNGLDLTAASDIETPVKEKALSEAIVEEEPELQQTKVKTPVDKELIEKTTKEYINSYYANEIKSLQKNVKKSFLLSLILFIISLLMIVFMYFTFSVNLDSKQEEIDVLKKRLGISYFQTDCNNINSV